MAEGQGRSISTGFVAASLGIFISRVSGLIRDIVLGAYWGTGAAFGAFLVAFTIPNLFRSLLGEGALSEGFVPMFNERLEKEGKASAFRMLCQVLTLVSFVLLAVIFVGMVGCLVATLLLPPGRTELTLQLTAAMLPYTFFICLVGFLTGVLNSFGRFSLPFLAPVILNVLFIVGTWWLAPRLGAQPERQIFALAIAVLVAGVIQLGSLAWVLRGQGFGYRFSLVWQSESMRELRSLVLPAAFGAAIYQVNVLCDRLVASWLGGYAVTSLYYSERLIFLPIGIFAVALSAACIPIMSRAVARDDEAEMAGALLYSLRHILFLTLPCVVVFIFLGRPIIELIFQRGNFTADSTDFTLAALLYYAPGVPAFAAAKIIRSGYFSRKDTRTPVRVAGLCMVINLVLNLVLMGPLQQRGLALATVVSAWTNVLLLTFLLSRAVTFAPADLRRFAGSLINILLACVAAAGVIYRYGDLLQVQTGSLLLDKLIAVLLPIAVAAGAFLIVHALTGARELRELLAVFKRKLPKAG